MVNRAHDIMDVFSEVKPFPELWEPARGKRHEGAQAADVIRRLTDYSKRVADYVRGQPGLKISSSFDLSRKDVVAKNVSWLTSVSLLELGHLRFTVDSDDPETYDELAGKISRIRAQIEPFLQLKEAGIVVPVPTTIDEYDGIFNQSHKVDLGSEVIQAGFTNGFLARQMTEVGASTPPGIVEFLLPRVAGIPLLDILRLRSEKSQSFTRFQKAVVDFVTASDAATSEAKLVDLMLQVDSEIERLKTEFERLDERRLLERLGVAYSFGVLSLVLVLPSELFQSFAALFGSQSILKSARNLRLIAADRRELEDDPFYLPYRLTILAKQLE